VAQRGAAMTGTANSLPSLNGWSPPPSATTRSGGKECAICPALQHRPTTGNQNATSQNRTRALATPFLSSLPKPPEPMPEIPAARRAADPNAKQTISSNDVKFSIAGIWGRGIGPGDHRNDGVTFLLVLELQNLLSQSFSFYLSLCHCSRRWLGLFFSESYSDGGEQSPTLPRSCK